MQRPGHHTATQSKPHARRSLLRRSRCTQTLASTVEDGDRQEGDSLQMAPHTTRHQLRLPPTAAAPPHARHA